ncbi:MAG: SpoIIE family protein phosphatase [Nocardioides sp.]|nr:SpoIIE family protein phosphatase [Nocardioides sp.]
MPRVRPRRGQARRSLVTLRGILGGRSPRPEDVSLTLGLGVLALLVVVDAAASVHLSGAYAAGAVITATAASARRTTVVAVLAVALGAASTTWHDTLGTYDWGLRLLANVLISGTAVAVASIGHHLRARIIGATMMMQELVDSLAGELIGARTISAVSEAFVTKAPVALGADQVRVHVLDADKALRPLAWHGKEPAREVTHGSDHPKARVAETGQPLHLRDRAEIAAHFPDLVTRRDAHARAARSVHVLPLAKDGVVEGVLTISFPPSHPLPRTQEDFLVSISGALGEALHRAADLAREDLAAQRLQLLHESAATLAGSLDVDTTVTEVCRLLVPRFADWCAVHLERDGTLDTVALQHVDPVRTRWALGMMEGFPTPAEDAPTGARAVMRSGRSEHYPFIPSELLETAASSPEHLALLRQLGMRSAMVVPLLGRSGPLGAITLVQAESGRQYAEEDVTFLEQLAGHAAHALETAVTFADQTERLADMTKVAEAAQQAILAPPPERVGPVRLAARYRGAASEAQIGGDLFEVVPVDGAVRLLIGDVRGKGLTAVRTATIVLGEFRAAAAETGDLARIARSIDRGMRPYLANPEDFVTACLLEITADGRFSAVSCGHPAPVHLSAGRLTEVPVDHAPPLGLGASPVPAHGRLQHGDRLVMFTDGLIEARTPNRAFVDAATVLSALAAAPFELALDTALESLEGQTSGSLDDDLALLLAEYDPKD